MCSYHDWGIRVCNLKFEFSRSRKKRSWFPEDRLRLQLPKILLKLWIREGSCWGSLIKIWLRDHSRNFREDENSLTQFKNFFVSIWEMYEIKVSSCRSTFLGRNLNLMIPISSPSPVFIWIYCLPACEYYYWKKIETYFNRVSNTGKIDSHNFKGLFGKETERQKQETAFL